MSEVGPRVVLEFADRADGWRQVGSLSVDEPCGSITSEDGTARNVYLFGALDGTVGVWRSLAGVDVANDAVRVIATAGLQLLADLAHGTYELPIVRNQARVKVRFRLEDGTR